MTRAELCSLLGLADDASVHTIRARAARVATGKAEFGSAPAKRRALADALHLSPGCSDIAILRVVESHLSYPLDWRRDACTRVVDAGGARTRTF